MELREHPLALRAQEVCAEQTMAVNELFRTYGRAVCLSVPELPDVLVCLHSGHD